MTEAQLSAVDINSVDPNPHRLLATYPFDDDRIEKLERSIKDVGLWESLIARPVGNRYQLAFGHKRLEAARRARLKTVPLIVRDLTDRQMLEFMGRENLEDWNADFLIMLETWEAAVRFPERSGKSSKPIEIAGLLGWTTLHVSGAVQLNDTARACSAAHSLIEGEHLTRDDLAGMPVKVVQEIVERTLNRIDLIERAGAAGKRPRSQIKDDTITIAKAAKSVAKDVRAGTVARKQVRQEVDYRAVKGATAKNKASPLFAAFAKQVADNIHGMLVSDRAAEKLADMQKALSLVTLEEDRQALKRIIFALEKHEEVTHGWIEKLDIRQAPKVVSFKQLAKE